MTPYETRVRELEQEGCDTSDAQGIADVEFIQKSAVTLYEALEDCYAELNQLAFLSGDKLASITLNKAQAALSKARGEQ
jgi:hypothetical protein